LTKRYTNSSVKICKIRTRLSSVWTGLSRFYGSGGINKRSSVWSSANSGSVELTHFYRMDRFHIHTPVLCLVAVALLPRNQSVLVCDVLAVDAKTVATHVRTVELPLKNKMWRLRRTVSIVGGDN
jgi:hypothetical protein